MGNYIKVGVLSDTHIPTRARKLPNLEKFQDVDYIIHAGDYVNLSVIEDLQKIAPVIGCHGNMDPAALKKKLPEIATLEIGTKIVKIIHDLGWESKIIKKMKKEKVDVIVHGHTHKASIKKGETLLIVNPGSATNSFLASNSIGVLYFYPDNIEFEIIELK
ncbi:MAG TPA: YfcE family phosphodiesterase [Candidatus Deferrimicrobium sp.]|nr:YfcE family phosphodiesterase [Candidatus Deferrimicrobium sp.]